MVDRLVFRNSVEGMLRALGPQLSPEVKSEVLSLGVNPDELEPIYDVQTYLLLVDFIGGRRFPSLSGDERDRELGREFIRGFSKTLVGRATFVSSRTLGPMCGTLNLARTLRMVNNYATAEAIPLTESSVQVRCRPVLRPHYYQGILEQAGWDMHVPSYQVELENFEHERADFMISW